MKDKKHKDEKNLGIDAEKDEFSNWYTQILLKAELIDYSPVSGCYILRPRAYAIWEKVQHYFDNLIKNDGVKNVYFPLLIPENLLNKEKEHVKGFSPEVAWVTEAGNTKLSERLAIRPTSETIMYSSFSKWIHSWRDLPLRINQWANIVRWEFKHPLPLIRSREFLWQEGHSVFALQNEADEEVYKIREFYESVFKNMYAVPVIKGRKTEKEKFAGADYTLSTEVFLPSGKAIQGATTHNLGQNFSKSFDITFLDKNEKKTYPFQTSWGLSTRSIGIAIMMHSDDKGLVLSPRVAETQIIIVPIFTEENKKVILKAAQDIKDKLKGYSVEIDISDKTPGFKFNDSELKGIPIRIELGKKDLDKNEVTIFRRDTLKKESVKIKDISDKIKKLIDDIHNNLYYKAEEFLQKSTISVNDMIKLKKTISDKKLGVAEWCGDEKCEDNIKSETGGAKIICINEDTKPKKNCVNCKKKSKYVIYVAKSY